MIFIHFGHLARAYLRRCTGNMFSVCTLRDPISFHTQPLITQNKTDPTRFRHSIYIYNFAMVKFAMTGVPKERDRERSFTMFAAFVVCERFGNDVNLINTERECEQSFHFI